MVSSPSESGFSEYLYLILGSFKASYMLRLSLEACMVWEMPQYQHRRQVPFVGVISLYC